MEQICDQRVGLLRGKVIPDGVVNMVTGPWETDARSGMIVKQFPDGSRLRLPADGFTGQASVAIFSADAISAGRFGQITGTEDRQVLPGIVSALRRACSNDQLLLEVMAAGSLFQIKVDRQRLETENLLPGVKVQLCFLAKAVRWL